MAIIKTLAADVVFKFEGTASNKMQYDNSGHTGGDPAVDIPSSVVEMTHDTVYSPVIDMSTYSKITLQAMAKADWTEHLSYSGGPPLTPHTNNAIVLVVLSDDSVVPKRISHEVIDTFPSGAIVDFVSDDTFKKIEFLLADFTEGDAGFDFSKVADIRIVFQMGNEPPYAPLDFDAPHAVNAIVQIDDLRIE